MVSSLTILRLRFGSAVASAAGKFVKTGFQRMLNFSIRVTHNKEKREHINDLRVQHKWRNVENLLTEEFSRICQEAAKGNVSK